MEHNLERDMKDASWFVAKVRNDEAYAQNVYAALCNNAFQKIEMMSILRDEAWSCTWRYAGGLVADIRCEGDYMDWYCSGIRDFGADYNDSVTMELTEEQIKNIFIFSSYMHEGHITDEIREDFKRLGWTVVEGHYNDDL